MKTLAATLVLICSTTASAEFMSGNELFTRLNSENGYDRGSAMGYIMGSFDSLVGVAHCAPSVVTAGQVRDMVHRALQDAPSVRHLSADSFVTYVAKKAWPCANKQGGASL